MEAVLGFSIAVFLTVVSLDTIQHRRRNLKQMGNKPYDQH